MHDYDDLDLMWDDSEVDASVGDDAWEEFKNFIGLLAFLAVLVVLGVIS